MLTGKFEFAPESVLPGATPENLDRDTLALGELVPVLHSKRTEQDAL
ncbi:hypothetical protein ACIA8F_29170 [Streptomyces sp. NPDC051563]